MGQRHSCSPGTWCARAVMRAAPAEMPFPPCPAPALHSKGMEVRLRADSSSLSGALNAPQAGMSVRWSADGGKPPLAVRVKQGAPHPRLAALKASERASGLPRWRRVVGGSTSGVPFSPVSLLRRSSGWISRRHAVLRNAPPPRYSAWRRPAASRPLRRRPPAAVSSSTRAVAPLCIIAGSNGAA